jgi:hypothetical protein
MQADYLIEIGNNITYVRLGKEKLRRNAGLFYLKQYKRIVSKWSG